MILGSVLFRSLSNTRDVGAERRSTQPPDGFCRSLQTPVGWSTLKYQDTSGLDIPIHGPSGP